MLRSDVFHQHLFRTKKATLYELKRTLDTQVDLTVFRKLKHVDCFTSYSHCACYYMLRKMASTPMDCGLIKQSGSLVTARC